jgi:hypothetical protein
MCVTPDRGKNGLATAFITLTAEPGAIIDGTGLAPVGRQGLITIAGSSYVRVEGFEIRNFIHNGTERTPVGILVQGFGSQLQVVNNRIHDIKNTSTCTDPCAAGAHGIGICSSCGANDRVRNGLIRGNSARNNSSSSDPWYGGEGSPAGFYVDGARYLVFERNHSTGNALRFEFASEHPGKATEDIDGEARSEGTIDLGGDEYGTAAAVP